jgi:hypothetical protein
VGVREVVVSRLDETAQAGGELDGDGLPLVPPLPAGCQALSGARGLARLAGGWETGILGVRTSALTAAVIFADRAPVDGLAVRGGLWVVGPEALGEIRDVPLGRLTVADLPPLLAHELGSYFLPTELAGLPANGVVIEDLVRSLARPGRRGCAVVRGQNALGLVFIAGGGVVLAYRQDGVIGGLEEVAPLLTWPGATLWARLGTERVEHAALTAPPPLEPELRQATARVEPGQTPDHPPLDVPPPVAQRAAPEGSTLSGPVPTGAAARLDHNQEVGARELDPREVAMEEARAVLGRHAVRVEGVFRHAGPTSDSMRAAAEHVRTVRVRLVDRARLELVADRVIAALEGRGGG